MTAQFSDSIDYRSRSYGLAGINGEGMFHPRMIGLEPAARCSACWAGFLCEYRVAEGRLTLWTLDLALDAPKAPDIAGRRGVSRKGLLDFVYEEMDLPVPFTGALLAATGFIKELYEHMGHHPAWKFEEVHELIFEKGALTAEHDRSARMKEVRDKVLEEGLGPRSWEDMARLINSCFDRSYSY